MAEPELCTQGSPPASQLSWEQHSACGSCQTGTNPIPISTHCCVTGQCNVPQTPQLRLSVLPPSCCCRSKGSHQQEPHQGAAVSSCTPPALPAALPGDFPGEVTNLQPSLALGGGHFCTGCATAVGEHHCWAGLSSEQWPCTQT